MAKSQRRLCGRTEDRTLDLRNTSRTVHSTDLAGPAIQNMLQIVWLAYSRRATKNTAIKRDWVNNLACALNPWGCIWLTNSVNLWQALQTIWKFNIGIKHDFPFINIRKVSREVLKTEGEARGFQHLPRDLANVNEWQNHVWSLLLHKFKENTPKIEKIFAHFILQPYHHFLTRARFL